MSRDLCMRCAAPYDSNGRCTNASEGCQGGRGENTYEPLPALPLRVVNFVQPPDWRQRILYAREVARLAGDAAMLALDARERLAFGKTDVPNCDVCAALGAPCKTHEEAVRRAKEDSDQNDVAFVRIWNRIGEVLTQPGCGSYPLRGLRCAVGARASDEGWRSGTGHCEGQRCQIGACYCACEKCASMGEPLKGEPGFTIGDSPPLDLDAAPVASEFVMPFRVWSVSRVGVNVEVTYGSFESVSLLASDAVEIGRLLLDSYPRTKTSLLLPNHLQGRTERWSLAAGAGGSVFLKNCATFYLVPMGSYIQIAPEHVPSIAKAMIDLGSKDA